MTRIGHQHVSGMLEHVLDMRRDESIILLFFVSYTYYSNELYELNRTNLSAIFFYEHILFIYYIFHFFLTCPQHIMS